MARRTQKSFESLAKDLAHRSEVLSDFERLLFWTRLLWLPDPARALATMAGSAHQDDRAHTQRVTASGIEQARLVATLELAILSDASPNPAMGKSQFASVLFVWHDWASYEMELFDWLSALPKEALARELTDRVSRGLSRATAETILGAPLTSLHQAPR